MTTGNTANPSPAVWSWAPTTTAALRRNVGLTSAAMALGIAIAVAIAVASPARFSIVVAFLIAGVALFWLIEHRQFRATRVEVDADGVLRVDDGRRSSSIDLATVDTIAVRLRTESGQSIWLTTPRWSIEIAGPNGTLSHPLAQAVGLFNPDEDDLGALEAGLRAQAERFGAQITDRPERGRTPGQSERASGDIVSQPGTSMLSGPSLGDPIGDAVDGRFEWRPPVSPKAERRRRWFRIGYVGAALLIAGIGVASAWGDWVGVVLSAITVPGLLLLFCGGIDYALGRARRFHIVVNDGVLTISPGADKHRIALEGAKVRIDKASQLTAQANSTVRTVHWYIDVQRADGLSLQRSFPGWGTTTVHDDYVALERELRRRT